MSALYNVGMCCTIISIWGVLQLTIMGIFYSFEVVTLLEDVEAHEYEDYDDFIKKTSNNYAKTAVNCWVAAAIYFFLILISLGCIAKANINMKKEAELLEDTEQFCTPKSFM